MKLFSKPEGGWVDINIGDYIMCASYLTDVPMDFLNTLIASLKYNIPICVYIDEEGFEDFLCVFGNMLTISRMIEVSGEMKQVDFKFNRINYNAFVREIILGIEEYFDDWVNWNMNPDEDLKLRAKKIQEKLNEAKEIIQQLKLSKRGL